MKTYQIPETALKMQKLAGERPIYSGVRFNNHTATVTDGHRAMFHLISDIHKDLLPDKATWRFSGKKPSNGKYGGINTYPFSVNGGDLAVDTIGGAKGNATILKEGEHGSYPPVAECFPDKLENKIIISLNAKSLYEMAKVLTDDNHMINLIIDPITPDKADSHQIVVTGRNTDTVGLLMGCRPRESDKVHAQNMIADYKKRVNHE